MRYLYFFAVLFLSLQIVLAGQTQNGKQYEKINNKWYQVENGINYLVDENVITVKFKSTASFNSKENFNTSQGVTTLRTNAIGYVDLQLSSGSNPLTIVQNYLNSGLAEVAEVNTIGEYVGAPNDPRFSDQWHLQDANDHDIDAPEAWDYDTGDPDVIIAILDSGTDILHEDLEGNIWVNPGEDDDGDGVVWDSDDFNGIDDDGNGRIDDVVGWDFYNNNKEVEGPYYHGTLVAGIAGAVTHNNTGVAGVAGGWSSSTHGSNLLICGVGDSYPSGSILDDAILYAASKGAKVITMSLTVGSSAAITSAIESAYLTYGSFIDCASGNEYSSSVAYPANVDYVLAVGATNQSDQRASFSNYGSDLDVVAPGVDIWGTLKNDSYGGGNGTSFAAPQIAGIASMLISYNSNYTNEDIWEIIAHSCEKVGGYSYGTNASKPYASWNNEMGYGRVNALFAVAPPAIPENFDGSWQNAHPHLTWSANIESDLKYYEVWKKRSTWSLLTTTTNNYYTDTGEFKYTPGHTKTYVYYKIRAVDFTDQVSDYTNDEGFAVNAPEQSTQELYDLVDIYAKIPKEYELNQNHPNPFNPITQIRFGLPEAGFTTVKVYDIQGKLIRTLVNSNLEAGYHTYSFSGENLSSGIYFYELKSSAFHQLKRMLLLK